MPWSLTTGGRGADDADLRPDELLLRRDVLDVQIIDLAGRRLTRVSDVLLDEAPSGALTVKGVDVSARALVRRFGWPSGGSSSSDDLVPFDKLHLTSERGHAIQLASSLPAIAQTSHEDLSAALSGLDLRKASDVVQKVDPHRAAAALLLTDRDVASNLLGVLPEEHAATIRGHLPTGSQRSHPHLYVTEGQPPRRLRRFAGWKRRMPRRRDVAK